MSYVKRSTLGGYQDLGDWICTDSDVAFAQDTFKILQWTYGQASGKVRFKYSASFKSLVTAFSEKMAELETSVLWSPSLKCQIKDLGVRAKELNETIGAEIPGLVTPKTPDKPRSAEDLLTSLFKNLSSTAITIGIGIGVFMLAKDAINKKW